MYDYEYGLYNACILHRTELSGTILALIYESDEDYVAQNRKPIHGEHQQNI